jgi:thymidylate synthase
MKQYLDLLQNIIDNGVEKESGRANMPNTIGISKADISMDLANGFPLLTTKKMYWKGIVHELLWFLRGETNIRYLVDNKVNIWNGDAYRWYLKFVGTLVEPDYDYLMDDPTENKTRPFTMEEFVEAIKSGNLGTDPSYKLGDLGKVYGYQWRNQNGVDQVKDVIEGLKENPYSRYHIIDGWQKSDFPEMALPPCHLLYQFIVRPLSFDQRMNIYRERNSGMMLNFDSIDRVTKAFDELGIPKFYLDLNMYQRSVDTFLGASFNVASMSLLLMIFAKASNMIAGVANWIGGDTHLYINHIEQAKEQIKRKPFHLPTMNINKELKNLEDILNLSINDFEINNYLYHPTIKAELFTGLKK